ncbi:MAG: class I SAM-dependent methyltransferase [Clostridia bacterium]|nr:class I SAM-dependent methyltransferase [Clostridia bacterium]
MAQESRLREKIKYLESIPNVNRNLDRIISSGTVSDEDVRHYYVNSRFAYKKFHSEEGFMHFRISQGGKLGPNDIYYQPETVSKRIKSGDNVVELGSGMGANLLYLAKKHPDVTFTGVDLCPEPIEEPPSNIRLIEHDYSDMSMIDDASVDAVYAVETIVHCPDKESVFSEVYRILKPDGVFIVYDYSLPREFEEYDETEKKAVELISKGGAAVLIESETCWEGRFAAAGFKAESITDLTKNTLPDLRRLAGRAAQVLENSFRVKFAAPLMPKRLFDNIILGYLGYDMCLEGVGYYMEWIYRK